MKAVRIIEPYKMAMFDLPEPKIGAEDVLIQVKALGLCGSDLSTYRGLNPMVSYVTFQMAEVLVSRSLFYEILEKIKRLKPIPIGYD